MENQLIKGDNLYILKNKLSEFADKIKVIYIDPPYNTGNNQLNYIDSRKNWSEFMKPRLEISRKMLRNDGVIFLHCDNHAFMEAINLMNDIFGKENFIECFIYEKTQHNNMSAKNSICIHEYIICYAKQLYDGNKKKNLLIEKQISEFVDAPLYNESSSLSEIIFPPLKVKFSIPDGIYIEGNDKFEILEKFEVVDGYNISPIKMRFKCRWSQKRLDKEIELGSTFIIKTSKLSPRVIYSENKNIRDLSPKSILFSNPRNRTELNNIKIGNTFSGKRDLERECENAGFLYPKSLDLLKYLITISSRENDIVMDFFAGSGTTLSAADQLNRKWIGIEENDYIRTITYKRLKNIGSNFIFYDEHDFLLYDLI